MKELDPNKIKINEKSNKSILIYYIGYVTFNEVNYVKINSANPLYLIINKINGYFEEINGLNIWHWVLPKRQRQNKKVWRSMEQNQRYYKYQQLMTQTIMMKDIYGNQIQLGWWFTFKKSLEFCNIIIVVRTVFYGENR